MSLIRLSRRALVLSGAALALRGQDQTKLRLGIVGTGHRAWGHIQVVKAIPSFEIAALADPAAEFLDHAASLVGGKVATFPTYQQMLEAEKLDAVLVSTPSFLHAEVTIAALEKGLHVLCEKPMATSVEDANRMIAAAKQSGKILQIGLQLRYTPKFAKLVETSRGGAIGPVELVTCNLFRGDWNPQSWKYPDSRSGVATNWRYLTHTARSSLLEDGIHEIDVLHWLIDKPIARIFAMGGNNLFRRETIDHAQILIEYEGGVKFNMNFTLLAPNIGPAGRQMIVIGKDGNLQLDITNYIELRTASGPARRIPTEDAPPRAVEAHQAGIGQDIGTYRQFLAFVDSIRTGREPLVDGQAGKTVVKICLLAEKSLREGRVVAWNDLPA